MNRKHLITILSLTLLLIPIGAAANNQNLEWSIELEHEMQIQYHETHVITSASITDEFGINETFHLKVTQLPTIPNDTVGLVFTPPSIDVVIPYVEASTRWPNGTLVDTDLYVIELQSIRSSRIAIPVGNWSLLSQYVNDLDAIETSVNYSLNEDSSVWGYRRWYNASNFFGDEQWSFFKVDGTLDTFVRNSTTWNSEFRMSIQVMITRLDVPITTSGLGYSPIWLNNLTLVLSAFATIAMVIIVYWRRRMKTKTS